MTKIRNGIKFNFLIMLASLSIFKLLHKSVIGHHIINWVLVACDVIVITMGTLTLYVVFLTKMKRR